MTRKLMVGVIAASLLVSGGLVGVSYGQGGGITEPEVIELSFGFCEPSCRSYPLSASGGGPAAQITLGKFTLFDVDGNRVGTIHESCVNSETGPWICTLIHKLKAGPHTERGTVVTNGTWSFDPVIAADFAITGGTGAYANVRGFATWDEEGTYSLNLFP